MGPFLLPLLIVANFLGVGMVVPQAVRLHRTRRAAGVSTIWVGISLSMNLWWLAYGVQGQLWGLVPVSVGAVLVYGVIAAQLMVLVGPPARVPVAVGAAGPLLLFGSILPVAGWSAVGLGLGLAYGLQFAPAAIGAIRARDTAGISLATWVMALAEAMIWVVYGLNVADRALLVGGTGGSVAASLIIVRVAMVRAGPRSQPVPSTA